MVFIPSCTAKVCKRSYYNNCAVKVHVCVGVALIKRTIVKPTKLHCITEIISGHGEVPNIIMQPHVTISSFQTLLRLYLVKKTINAFFLSQEGEEGCQFKGLITAFLYKNYPGQTHQFAVRILLVFKLIQHFHLKNH